MNMQIVDMAPFWWEVAAPAALATILAAGYVCAAWRWPALQTPIASFKVRRQRKRLVATLDKAFWKATAVWQVRVKSGDWRTAFCWADLALEMDDLCRSLERGEPL